MTMCSCPDRRKEAVVLTFLSLCLVQQVMWPQVVRLVRLPAVTKKPRLDLGSLSHQGYSSTLHLRHRSAWHFTVGSDNVRPWVSK